mmetsp:Transcript_113426/g.301407  ORF Transcript_113426/g.301407 Transcript_113426/m.301407 type:complete len:251 (-) Transcript_113426:1679-2431(-)
MSGAQMPMPLAASPWRPRRRILEGRSGSRRSSRARRARQRRRGRRMRRTWRPRRSGCAGCPRWRVLRGRRRTRAPRRSRRLGCPRWRALRGHQSTLGMTATRRRTHSKVWMRRKDLTYNITWTCERRGRRRRRRPMTPMALRTRRKRPQRPGIRRHLPRMGAERRRRREAWQKAMTIGAWISASKRPPRMTSWIRSASSRKTWQHPAGSTRSGRQLLPARRVIRQALSQALRALHAARLRTTAKLLQSGS